jgi:hypothetical protein
LVVAFLDTSTIDNLFYQWLMTQEKAAEAASSTKQINDDCQVSLSPVPSHDLAWWLAAMAFCLARPRSWAVCPRVDLPLERYRLFYRCWNRVSELLPWNFLCKQRKTPDIQNPNCQLGQIALCFANFPCGEVAGIAGKSVSYQGGAEFVPLRRLFYFTDHTYSKHYR